MSKCHFAVFIGFLQRLAFKYCTGLTWTIWQEVSSVWSSQSAFWSHLPSNHLSLWKTLLKLKFHCCNNLWFWCSKQTLLPCSFCLTFFPCQHRDQKCKWIGPLYNLFFYRRYQRDRAGLLDPLPYNLYHICLLTRGVLGLYENTHRHAPFSQKIHHFWWIVTTSGWWTHTEYLFMEMKTKMFHLPSCCSNGIANNRHLVKDLVHIGDITPRLKTRSLSQYLV